MVYNNIMTSNNTSDPLLTAFHHAVETMPFYREYLAQHHVLEDSIQTREDFKERVPLISKEDIFPLYSIETLCQKGETNDFVSAIVSSGTSGIFSYTLLTERDVAIQQQMFDTLMRALFQADTHKPVIINALPMGVSFVSSYPVIPTSVRADIVLHVIRTLKDTAEQFVIITDPHVLKKIVEEGVAQKFPWGTVRVSCVVGGTSFSDSYVQYIETLLSSGGEETELKFKNRVFGTMGITEVGLNIFGGTPDLNAIRHQLQVDSTMSREVFGTDIPACPEIMYMMSQTVHVEVCNPNEQGIGDIVVSHLDCDLKTMLIRYKTGDIGKILDSATIERVVGITPALPYPIIAIFGRSTEMMSTGITPATVKELLYRDHSFASHITGHFIVDETEGAQKVYVQMKQECTTATMPVVEGIEMVGVAYADFPRDMELNYENKWKHTS